MLSPEPEVFRCQLVVESADVSRAAIDEVRLKR